eukprot:3737129-Heterocapsa_arctica.AAC.1
MVRDALLDAGIALRLRPGPHAFWGDSAMPEEAPCDGAPLVPIVDAAFVDDECLMLTASSPAVLDAAIDSLLTI